MQQVFVEVPNLEERVEAAVTHPSTSLSVPLSLTSKLPAVWRTKWSLYWSGRSLKQPQLPINRRRCGRQFFILRFRCTSSCQNGLFMPRANIGISRRFINIEAFVFLPYESRNGVHNSFSWGEMARVVVDCWSGSPHNPQAVKSKQIAYFLWPTICDTRCVKLESNTPSALSSKISCT